MNGDELVGGLLAGRCESWLFAPVGRCANLPGRDGLLSVKRERSAGPERTDERPGELRYLSSVRATRLRQCWRWWTSESWTTRPVRISSSSPQRGTRRQPPIRMTGMPSRPPVRS